MQTPVPISISPHRIDTGLQPAYVHLKVASLENQVAFYQQALGLHLHWQNGDSAALGAGGPDLIRLTQIPNARRYRGVTGLYHFAILYPNRYELARAVARLFALRWQNSPTDHILTKTTYLEDPEGNTIELYCESPEDGIFAVENGEFIASRADGSSSDGREPLDLDALFAHLGDRYTPEGFVPPETRLGHFHLHVADLQETRRYYHDLLGFDDMGIGQRYRMGMLSAGGYHHHIGYNTWQGQNAPPPPPDALGLDHIAFTFPPPRPGKTSRPASKNSNCPTKKPKPACNSKTPPKPPCSSNPRPDSLLSNHHSLTLMRYTDLPIQTHREAPANARSEGQSWLVRAGYLSHSGEILPLGERALTKIRACLHTPADFHQIGLTTLDGAPEHYYPTPVGSHEIIYCPSCGTASRAETAQYQKAAPAPEPPAPLEKVPTPNCPTIESLAAFLNIPTSKTAKAIMCISLGGNSIRDTRYSILESPNTESSNVELSNHRISNNKLSSIEFSNNESSNIAPSNFLFLIIRGDTALSEAKLEALVGKFRLATDDEIRAIGAVPGYASPIGVKNARILVDDLIPASPNLVAGANESGYHLRNTNYGRDYIADTIADLIWAVPGDPCIHCASALSATRGWILASGAGFDPEKTLLALAESHHDDKGLALPAPVAPFDIYLMHVPGKTMDTLPAAQDLYAKLTAAGIFVLFDDRNDRAGVKFNDADLIGCPIRITLGERGLQNGVAEVKRRSGGEVEQVAIGFVVETVKLARA
jgi:catechol 2,3-dioxygenase